MDWLTDAWDSFTGLFGGSELSDNAQSVLGDIDIDGSGSIGGMDISDFKSGYDYYSMDDDYGAALASIPDNVSNNPNVKPGKSFLDSFLSPSVIGAAITSGAGLLNGMSAMDIQKQNLKAQAEEKKMNQLLELAKLKYQLMGKGASGSSGRKGGGAKGPTAQEINAQYSGNLASGYTGLANNLSSVYR